MKSTCILLAAGKSSRFSPTKNKILASVGGLPAFIYSVKAFVATGLFDSYVITYIDAVQRHELEQALTNHLPELEGIKWAQGGHRRQDSVHNAIKAITWEANFVFIHDCARVLIQADQIKELYNSLKGHSAVSLAHPVNDTIKQVSSDNPELLKDLDRDKLWATETPQAFHYPLIKEAYDYVQKEGLSITDDIAAVSVLNKSVHLVHNSSPNIKLTYAQDFEMIELILSQRSIKNHASSL